MSNHSAIEKCFEDGEDSGLLRLTHKGLKCFPNFVEDYDLVDVLFVDISRNRFVELPQEILSFVMVEKMDCSSNFLKTLPDLSNLNALTHLDVSQNQLQSIPVHICSLPLKILKASHNHLNVIPCEIGLLSKLQSMDISCNSLSNLPSTMGDLSSLRSLNVRRNQIVVLPDELSKLKNLCTLDFSCNRISAIPPAFRLISSLIELDLTNNPLSSPPAQICLKGRLHIVKYLSLAAQQQEKRWTVLKDKNTSPSSTIPSNSNLTERTQSERVENYDTAVNGLNETKTTVSSVENTQDNDILDSPTASNSESDAVEAEVTPSDCKPPTSPAKPTLPKKPNAFALTNQETREKKKFLQEKGKLTPQFKSRAAASSNSTPTNTGINDSDRPVVRAAASVGGVTTSPSTKSKDNEKHMRSDDKRVEEKKLINIEARKEKLLKNKEEIFQSRQRLECVRSKNMQRNKKDSLTNEKPNLLSPTSTESRVSTDSNQSGEVIFDGIGKRGSIGKGRSNSKKLRDGASNYTMRRFYDVAKEEFEELEKLREAMESKLRIKLPDDLPASLSDGIVLCHLINHLRKGTIQVIHVPSSGVPKLTMPKCQMNVDAFLDACRRVGVEKVNICTAPDILEEKSPIKLCRTVRALLQALGAAPPQISLAKPTTPR